MQSARGSRSRGGAAAEAHADLLIVGGGAGGCAAALAATSLGLRVVMTEETDWIGGQLTSQMVPPDESPWIEGQGCTARYRRYRDAVRQYYRDHYPLTPAARADPFLNPGQGTVSRLCHEPRVGVAVLEGSLAYARTAGLLDLRLRRVPVAASTDGDRVQAVSVVEPHSGRRETISADVVIDATELGDLLPLAGVEYVTGAESRGDTGEEHAVDGPAQPDNVQPLTWCLAVGHDPRPGADHTIDRPADYDAWRSYTPPTTPPWPGPLLSPVEVAPATLNPRNAPFFEDEYEDEVDPNRQFTGWWSYRRVIYPAHLASSRRIDEATILNWPHNDYMVASVIDRAAEEVGRHFDAARQLSLSLLYWLQTERPRPDGGCGYPGLYPRPDVSGAAGGLAKAPYIRESRRIRALRTVTEAHVGTVMRGGWDPARPPEDPGRRGAQPRAETFADSVGIGYYRIDLHPSTGGDNYIDISCLPFQIPLGALLPRRVENLLPACKNIGTTHITNGCYRLHPVEWNIGEAVGLLAGFCLRRSVIPRQVSERADLLSDFQRLLREQGVALEWLPVTAG